MISALMYLAAGFCALALFWSVSIDAIRDPGGYRDSLWPAADKLEHLSIAALLTAAAVVILGTPPFLAALVTVLLGVGWELAQRYPRIPYPSGTPGDASIYDIAYDALGSLAIAALVWWVRR